MAKGKGKSKATKGTRTAKQKAALKKTQAKARKARAEQAKVTTKPKARKAPKRSTAAKAPKVSRKRRGRRAGPAVTATVTGTIGKKKRHTYVGSGRVRTYIVNPVGTTGRLVLAVIMVPLGYLGVTAMSRALATRSSLSGATDSSGNAVALNGANAFRSFGRPDGVAVGAAAAATAGLGILTALVHKKHPLVTAILGGLAVGSGVKFAALGGEFIAHKLQLTQPSDSTVLMNRLFPEVYAGTAFADPLTSTTYTTQQGLPPARRQMFAGPVGAVAGVTNRPRSGAVGALRPVALRPVQSAKSISSQPKDERDELFDKVCAEVGAQSAK